MIEPSETSVSISSDGLTCSAAPGEDDKYFCISLSTQRRNLLLFGGAALIAVTARWIALTFMGASSTVGAVAACAALVLTIAVMRNSIVREEVILVEDAEARCVRIQCRSFDRFGGEHDFRRAHMPIDETLPKQVVLNECFVGFSSIHDVLGFIASIDNEPTASKANQEKNAEEDHENDSFVLAFEHFTPRLKLVEAVYRSTHTWLARVYDRHNHPT